MLVACPPWLGAGSLPGDGLGLPLPHEWSACVLAFSAHHLWPGVGLLFSFVVSDCLAFRLSDWGPRLAEGNVGCVFVLRGGLALVSGGALVCTSCGKARFMELVVLGPDCRWLPWGGGLWGSLCGHPLAPGPCFEGGLFSIVLRHELALPRGPL